MSKSLRNVPTTPKRPQSWGPTAAAARRLLTGVSLLALSALIPAAADAAGVETIYSFAGAPNDGASPRGRLNVVVTTKDVGPVGPFSLVETGFTIYGTTIAGGGGGGSCPSSSAPAGCGTVFELTSPPTLPGHPRSWTETVLYSFPGFLDPNSDGLNPSGGVIFDPACRAEIFMGRPASAAIPATAPCSSCSPRLRERRAFCTTLQVPRP
jgi:hypothetical protein